MGFRQGGDRGKAETDNTFVDPAADITYVVFIVGHSFMNSNQAKRFLARKGATFSPGKGGHLVVHLNGRRAVLPQHGGSKEL